MDLPTHEPKENIPTFIETMERFREVVIPAWRGVTRLVHSEYPERLSLAEIVDTWGVDAFLTREEIEAVKEVDAFLNQLFWEQSDD